MYAPFFVIVVFMFVSSFSFSLARVIAGPVPKVNVLNLLGTGADKVLQK
jgi:multisubunit Na+/H+ antiporter MnhF subunit